MKYLRKFETSDEMSAWQIGSEHVSPNVVLTTDTGSVAYNVSALSGVYIQHIDGSLYTTDQWSANGFTSDEVNGVAVIDFAARFVIAKELISDSMTWASNRTTLVDGVLTTTNLATAETDYAGEANTALIAAIDTSEAAYSCANYEFPNGQMGYLPALGEWLVAYKYMANIDSAMSLIGGATISGTYWSSTQYNNSKAWRFYASNGTPSGYNKNFNHKVRAFSALPL